jgi:hypothetical protein
MKVKTNPLYKYRKIAGAHYLIPAGEEALKREAPVELTETAAFIWRLLEEGRSLEEIAGAMTEEFEVDRERALKAAEEFAMALSEAGMASPVRDGR